MNDQNNNNKEFLKLCEQMQQNQRWNMVKDCVITMLTIIPTFYMIWQNHKKNRLTPKQRLMRNRAAQARLQLDEKFILQEAAHENELKQMETGLDVAESKFDFLSSLKQKGESLLKDKVTQVNKVVDDKLKQTTDKLKVDKFFDKDKKE